MFHYILKRLASAVLILIGVSFITFLLLFFMPADPARMIAGRSATADTVERIRHELYLDRPLPVQYLHYAGNLVQGDLGRSYVQKSKVSELIASRMIPSLQLMGGAILIELIIGLGIGIVSALKKDTAVDNSLMLLSFVGISTPQFVLGMIFLYIFSIHLRWFPIGGYGSFSNLFLPALTLGFSTSGWYARMMRSNLLELLRQDFLRTARAKGLTGTRILFGHALPNASLSIIAMIAIDIGIMMGGIVVVESVFGWPGIGQLAWQAISRVDIPVIMGVTLVTACAVVSANLLADVIVLLIDPRIKIK